MNKILVAVDDSQTSEPVMQKALEMAEKLNSDVLILTVITRLVRPIHTHSAKEPGHTYTEYENPKEMADQVLAHAEDVFKDFHGHHETLIEFGDPANKIIDVAEEKGCDLIIMGNRGLSVFKRVMMGSVSTKVLHNAPCHVLIVHGRET